MILRSECMTTRRVFDDDWPYEDRAASRAGAASNDRRSMAISLDSGGRRPVGFFVEGIDWPWQPAPGEVRQHRRGQARTIDLVDLLGPEELIEAGAEVAATLHDDHPCLGDVDAKDLELHWVHALAADRDDGDSDAAEVEQGGGAHVGRDILRVAAAADILAVAEFDYLGTTLEGLREFVAFFGVEL